MRTEPHAIYAQPISEDTSQGPDIIAVTGIVGIIPAATMRAVERGCPPPPGSRPPKPIHVGGYVHGCANMTPEERQNIIDALTRKAEEQVAELLQ